MIRHAEAEGNLYRRGQGQFDGRVTPKGRLQIAALAERFKDVQLSALYSSDLSRTVATAGAVLKYHGLPLITDRRLRELNLGCWEDVPWGNLAYADKAMMDNFSSDPDNWHVPGAESFQAVTARVTAAVEEYAGAHGGQSIAVVSHGMAIRAMLCHYLNIPSKEVMRVPHGDNTAVSLLRIGDGRVEVVYMNDNSHLDASTSTFIGQTWWKESSGAEDNNLRFEPLDLRKDSNFYLNCYRDAWRVSHGSEYGFVPELYLSCAKAHVKAHPLALMKVYRGDKVAGLVEFDAERGEDEGFGWLTLCYMLPEHRNQGLGVQLIGHALSAFRKLGRTRLRLHVSEENEHARKFYERYEFREIGGDPGAVGEMILMEKEI